MRFTAVLAASASLITLGYAADPLAFTSWPADVSAGKPVTLTWAGGVPDQPVTLTLRKGTAGNLDDVETITAQAKDGKFTWTPGDNVKEGQDYAFMVSQGAENNYSSLLKAGAPAPNVHQSAETATGATTTAPSTQTSAVSETTSAPETTGTNTDATSSMATGTTTGMTMTTSSKPLISSAASGTPSSSPVSTEMVTTSVAAESSSVTGQHRKAHKTGGNENGAAAPQFSLGLALGAIFAFAFGI